MVKTTTKKKNNNKEKTTTTNKKQQQNKKKTKKQKQTNKQKILYISTFDIPGHQILVNMDNLQQLSTPQYFAFTVFIHKVV